MIITDSHHKKKAAAIAAADAANAAATTPAHPQSVPTLCVISAHRAHPAVAATGAAAMTAGGGKKPGAPQHPSVMRQLLPIAACLLSFATVLSILIVYIDTTGRFRQWHYYTFVKI